MLTYAKALIAAAVAGLGAAGTALLDEQIAAIEWVGIATATLVALGAVWSVPNRVPPEPGAHAEHRERLHVRKVGGYSGTRDAADVPPPARLAPPPRPTLRLSPWSLLPRPHPRLRRPAHARRL